MRRILLTIALAVGGVVVLVLLLGRRAVPRLGSPASSVPVNTERAAEAPQATVPASGAALPAGVPVGSASRIRRGAPAVRVMAEHLEVPWALAFAPDGVLYVTERPGRLVRIRDGAPETVANVPDVSAIGEGGLLGLALDPAFAENRTLYLYHTTGSRSLKNRVVRYRLSDRGLEDQTILLDDIPGTRFHNGGRLAFGPDGNLFITTGDASQPALARDPRSLAGKILRIRPDGSLPADNPFPGSPVYSLGHRNPQGLAWDGNGQLYSTEHGPSSPAPNCCHDEVNRIEPGKNYGWSENLQRPPGPRRPPSGKLGIAGLEDPIVESGPRETWAPSGAAIVGDTLYFGGLRGQALYAIDVRNPVRVTAHLAGERGRIRDVLRGPDGALYLTTSNRDGRGHPRPGDDKILRIDPPTL